MLLEGCRALGLPIIVTQQYTRGLGPTIPELLEALPQDAREPVEKITFSCCEEPRFMERLEASGRQTVLLCGIEAHVCVAQTAVDLREAGYRPVVVADCVSSRRPLDRDTALERMRQEGVLVTTAESLLFELTRRAGTDLFRTISRLVKERPAGTASPQT